MSERSTPLPLTVEAYQRWRSEGLHSGGQFFVAKDGQIVADFALGEARAGVPMTVETPMIWLSATKPIAAVALAQLWERGLLEWDDPIARFVPEFGQRAKERITLRHALTHTGGFRLLNLGWPQASWEEVVDRICQAKPEPRWTLGETAGYHLASSWFMLGEVLRRVDGRRFEDYVRQEILEPLGMPGSRIGMSLEEAEAIQETVGVLHNTESRVATAFPWHKAPYLAHCNPGANGCGPIRELGRFYQMLLARGSLAGESGERRRILSPQSVEALTAPHRVGLYDKTFRAVLHWGLGFIVNAQPLVPEGDSETILPYGYGRLASRRTFGHSGRRSSTAFADPEHQLAVAFIVNGLPDEESHNRRTQDLTEAIYRDLGLAP
jgi:CubicO group peptidase (beta-lactamase class C family)